MALENLNLNEREPASGGLSALRDVAYSGRLPQVSMDMLPADVVDPAAKWEAFAAGALRSTPSGHFSESMSNAYGALAEGRNKEAELRAKYLPLVAQALLQRQMQAAQIAQMQWKLAQDFDQSGVAALTPLLTKQGDLTGADVSQALGAAVQRGLLPHDAALQLYKTLPTTDPTALRDAINRLSIGKLNSEQARGAVTPKVGLEDVGGTKQPVAVPPGQPGQSGPVGQPIAKTLSPGERLGAVGTEKDQAGNLTFFDRLTGQQTYPTNSRAPLGVQGGSGGPGSGRPLEAPPQQTVAGLKYQEDEGKRVSKYADDLNVSLEAMRQLQLRLGEMKQYITGFQPGATAEARLQLGRWLKDVGQSLGLSPEQSDKVATGIAKGDISNAQAYQKLAVQGALDMLKAANPRFTQAEFGVISQNNPNIALDPAALDKMMNFITKQYQFKSAEQSAFSDYVKGGGDITQWDTEWNKLAQQYGYIKPAKETGTAKGSKGSHQVQPVFTDTEGKRIRLTPKGFVYE